MRACSIGWCSSEVVAAIDRMLYDHEAISALGKHAEETEQEIEHWRAEADKWRAEYERKMSEVTTSSTA